ncbi:MAG: ExbD/TolR family protein [Burkholderiaceae bacterium]
MQTAMGRGRGRRAINEINMVPFIDVMLVLLIIFMVTAPLITPSVINLPSIGTAARQPDLVLQVEIDKDGLLNLKTPEGSAQMALREIAGAVKKAQAGASDPAVVISADRNVRYESVVTVMDALQRAGVQRVGLSVQLSGKAVQ